jgi:hypothetical protein
MAPTPIPAAQPKGERIFFAIVDPSLARRGDKTTNSPYSDR